MSTKHTPGPWEAVYNDHYWDIKLEGSYERIGDTCTSQFLSSGDNEEANARLIAAAPELLEALGTLERLAGTGMTQDEPARVAARAAIRKALGEEA